MPPGPESSDLFTRRPSPAVRRRSVAAHGQFSMLKPHITRVEPQRSFGGAIDDSGRPTMTLDRVAVMAALLLFSARCPGSGAERIQGEYWGLQTNGVRAGLYLLESNTETNRSLTKYMPMLENSLTNNGNRRPDRLDLWLPPLESCLQVSLRDQNGKPVPMTAMGKRLGAPITQPMRVMTGMNFPAGYRAIYLRPNEPSQVLAYIFSPEDYFIIPAPGKYRLSLRVRVIWLHEGWKGSLKSTNLPTVDLPPVEAELDLQKP